MGIKHIAVNNIFIQETAILYFVMGRCAITVNIIDNVAWINMLSLGICFAFQRPDILLNQRKTYGCKGAAKDFQLELTSLLD